MKLDYPIKVYTNDYYRLNFFYHQKNFAEQLVEDIKRENKKIIYKWK